MIRSFFILLFLFTIGNAFCQIKEIQLSHDPGFYQNPFYLKITTPNSGDIVYSYQNKFNRRSSVFPDSLLIDRTTSISFELRDRDSIFPIGSFSYFIGFNTDFKVVSMSIDDDYLFDTYKGIYVNGSPAYYDTIDKRMKRVNFNRGWERRLFVEVFDESKNRIINQTAGVKIFGGMTKYYPEKSLRIIAREEYGDNRFDADIFSEGKRKYKQFILRHSGNDYDELRFRDALLTSFARESGLDVQFSSPCHLFVNSEYWGVYNLREKINKYFIDNHYDIGTKGIDILQGYNTVEEGSDIAYKQLLDFIKKHDISLSENYSHVKKLMDVRNFMNFWIHQIYYGNHDARGNIRFWRSDSLDGRFRWILYDTDLSFIASRYRENTLKDFTSSTQTDWYNPRWATFLLRNLLLNEEFKKDFIHQYCFVLNTTLNKDNVLDRINSFIEIYEDEMILHFNDRKKFRRYKGSIKRWNKEISYVKLFAENRNSYSLKHLKDAFDLEDSYYLSLNISNSDHGKTFLNKNEIIDSLFIGKFYDKSPLPSGWEDSLIFAGERDTVSINISFIKNQNSSFDVIFNQIDYTNNCVELFNNQNEDILMNDWKILHDNNVFTIPSLTIPAKGFAVLHASMLDVVIDSVEYYNIPFDMDRFSGSLFLYDDLERLVDTVQYSHQDNSTISYTRNIPFDSLKNISSSWIHNYDLSIGYHNDFYTNFMSLEIEEKTEENKKINLGILYSIGVAALSLSLFFLIKDRLNI